MEQGIPALEGHILDQLSTTLLGLTPESIAVSLHRTCVDVEAACKQLLGRGLIVETRVPSATYVAVMTDPTMTSGQRAEMEDHAAHHYHPGYVLAKK